MLFEANLVKLSERVVARDDATNVDELRTQRHDLCQKLFENALLRQLIE